MLSIRFVLPSCLHSPAPVESYAVVNNFIKQQIEKGFGLYVYDYKYPDLSTIAYNHMLNHQKGTGKIHRSSM